MELHQLRYFVATAEAGSVTRAAARCRVAQPSLSQQLRKLESHLGAPLFDRQGRGMTLTGAGQALLPRARRILADVHEVEADLLRDVSRGTGSLAIGAIPTMAPYLLPPAIRTLRREFPACEVSVREDLTEHLVEALLDHDIDCALLSTPINEPRLTLERLGVEQLVVVVPSAGPLGEQTVLGVAELREQPAVLLEEIHCLGQQVQSFCSAKRVAPRVVCRTTQLGTILELVGLGLGVSIVPAMAAAVDKSPLRRYLRFKSSRPTREIAIAWHASRTRGVVALRLAELVREHVARAAQSKP